VKLLIRAANWVGDAVMSIPALGAVRRRWPSAHISILARRWVAELYRDQGLSDRLIIYDALGKHRGFFGREALAAELRNEKFDAALLLQNAFDAAWLAWRAQIPERIGYARDARRLLLTRAIAVPRSGEIPPHESHYYLELLRRAGWIEEIRDHIADSGTISLRVAPASLRQAAETLARAGTRAQLRIALAPGAAYGSAKCWPVERFAALADRLIAELNADVILFGTTAERAVTESISAAMRHRPVMLAGETSIGELPALLASCRLFIGNDSGAMHVAAAVGLPVVGIFGPTDPQGTAPATDQFTLVQEPVFCSPCFLRRCPIDHRCMLRITVDAVDAAARRSLASGSVHGG
jgi:heptosyltransferase-2